MSEKIESTENLENAEPQLAEGDLEEASGGIGKGPANYQVRCTNCGPKKSFHTKAEADQYIAISRGRCLSCLKGELLVFNMGWR